MVDVVANMVLVLTLSKDVVVAVDKVVDKVVVMAKAKVVAKALVKVVVLVALMSVSKVLLLVLGVRQTNAVAALGLKAELEVSADRPPAMIVR